MCVSVRGGAGRRRGGGVNRSLGFGVGSTWCCGVFSVGLWGGSGTLCSRAISRSLLSLCFSTSCLLLLPRRHMSAPAVLVLVLCCAARRAEQPRRADVRGADAGGPQQHHRRHRHIHRQAVSSSARILHCICFFLFPTNWCCTPLSLITVLFEHLLGSAYHLFHTCHANLPGRLPYELAPVLTAPSMSLLAEFGGCLSLTPPAGPPPPVLRCAGQVRAH